MVLRALIVDDEALARSRLRTLLGDCREPRVEVVAEAGNAVQAMDQIQRGGLDVIMLDVHMPGVDGMALAGALRNMPDPPAIIFVTAHAEHAVQAFELEAVDYLTKPVRLERLLRALQKVERLRSSEPAIIEGAGESLIIQERGRSERVALADVIYLKAELKYITVRTTDKEHIYDGALNDLEQRFRPPVRPRAPQRPGLAPPCAGGREAQRSGRGRRLDGAAGRRRRTPGGLAPATGGGARSLDGLTVAVDLLI
jgi:two-component system, LytTR family, response regulator AlgR